MCDKAYTSFVSIFASCALVQAAEFPCPEPWDLCNSTSVRLDRYFDFSGEYWVDDCCYDYYALTFPFDLSGFPFEFSEPFNATTIYFPPLETELVFMEGYTFALLFELESELRDGATFCRTGEPYQFPHVLPEMKIETHIEPSQFFITSPGGIYVREPRSKAIADRLTKVFVGRSYEVLRTDSTGEATVDRRGAHLIVTLGLESPAWEIPSSPAFYWFSNESRFNFKLNRFDGGLEPLFSYLRRNSYLRVRILYFDPTTFNPDNFYIPSVQEPGHPAVASGYGVPIDGLRYLNCPLSATSASD